MQIKNNETCLHICLCGNSKSYETCCGLLLSGKQKAATPEQLMRSRYSAFTCGDQAYLAHTMLEPAKSNFDFKNFDKWLTTVKWIKLEVLEAHTKDDKGFVEFIAHFLENGTKRSLHEISEFHKINDEWFYVSGQFTGRETLRQSAELTNGLLR